MTLKIKIHYREDLYGPVTKLSKIKQGDWIDVYSAINVTITPLIDYIGHAKSIREEFIAIERMLYDFEEISNGIELEKSYYDKITEQLNNKYKYYAKQLEELAKPTLIDLGFCAKMPEGYEAHLAPRSSTFKTFGLIQTNSVGVVDESYCGYNDVWRMPVISIYKHIDIKKGDKIGQFRIIEKMPEVEIEEADLRQEVDRGGFGSTGCTGSK
jgi:dUTP pyrophosphatase